MMRVRNIVILAVALCLMVSASFAVAAEYDYKDLIPALPGRIGGMPKAGDPDGGNVQASGQTWAAVEQRYSDGGGRIRLIVVAGSVAPQVQEFRKLTSLDLETDERIVKSAEILGRDAFFEIRKDRPGGTLGIALRDDVVAAIETNLDVTEGELLSLGEEIPLDDIAACVAR